jgi:hypothetical protein
VGEPGGVAVAGGTEVAGDAVVSFSGATDGEGFGAASCALAAETSVEMPTLAPKDTKRKVERVVMTLPIFDEFRAAILEESPLID